MFGRFLHSSDFDFVLISNIVVGQRFEFVRNIVGFVFISNTVGWQRFEVLVFFTVFGLFNCFSSVVVGQ